MVGILLDTFQEFIRRHIVFESERKQIPPLLVLAEAVGEENLSDAALVEGVNERAADESTRARHQHAAFLVQEDIWRVDSFFAAQPRSNGVALVSHGFGVFGEFFPVLVG